MMFHFEHSCHNHQDIDIASHRRELCRTIRTMLHLEHSCHNNQDFYIACHRRELCRTMPHLQHPCHSPLDALELRRHGGAASGIQVRSRACRSVFAIQVFLHKEEGRTDASPWMRVQHTRHGPLVDHVSIRFCMM
jgi:hypothetical protein